MQEQIVAIVMQDMSLQLDFRNELFTLTHNFTPGRARRSRKLPGRNQRLRTIRPLIPAYPAPRKAKGAPHYTRAAFTASQACDDDIRQFRSRLRMSSVHRQVGDEDIRLYPATIEAAPEQRSPPSRQRRCPATPIEAEHEHECR